MREERRIREGSTKTQCLQTLEVLLERGDRDEDDGRKTTENSAETSENDIKRGKIEQNEWKRPRNTRKLLSDV